MVWLLHWLAKAGFAVGSAGYSFGEFCAGQAEKRMRVTE